MINKKKITLSLATLQEFDGILTHGFFDWKQPMTYLSAAIRWFTKDYYNHTKVVLRITDWLINYANAHNKYSPDNKIDMTNAIVGNLCLIEAVQEGVVLDFNIEENILNEQICHKRNNLLKTLVTSEEIQEYRERAYFTVGKPYDIRGCLLNQLILQISEKLESPVSEIIGSDVELDVWIGNQGVKETSSFYCSKVYTFINEPAYPEWWDKSPADIHVNPQEITINEGFVKFITK